MNLGRLGERMAEAVIEEGQQGEFVTRIPQHTHITTGPVPGCSACEQNERAAERAKSGPPVGDRLKNGAWCLAAKYSYESERFSAPRYNWIVLTFHSGAGAEAPFAVGRCDPYGKINPTTYDYFATLPYALFNFDHERS